MKVLELFCGTKSISKAFAKAGHETFTVDNDPQHSPDLCINILEFEIKDLPKGWRTPDVIWASPPCTTFSVMSIPTYWCNGKPKSYKTYIGLAIAKKTLELIKEIDPLYWFIENPLGMLRKQNFMKLLPRKTVTYCQYGTKYRKATDIWTNNSFWIPKKMCANGDSCHEEARRGMRAGIQSDGKKLFGMSDWHNKKDCVKRAVIPDLLCEEIVKVCEGKQKIKQEILQLCEG